MAIQPAKIERDEDGFWTHPNFPDWGEAPSDKVVQDWKKENDVTTETIWFEIDASDDLQDRYFDEGDLSACADWEPDCGKPEAFLITLHDTEDGPVAVFAVPNQK